MPRNGSGSYDLPGADFTNGTLADADEVMTKLDDIASALTASLAKDGQTTPTAALPMGGFNHTGVGLATARTHYARASQAADGDLVYGGTAGGTANAVTIALSPAITAYVVGAEFNYKSGASANTGAVTVNVNSVGAGALTWPDGTALAPGDHPANAQVKIRVATTAPTFHLMSTARAVLFTEPGHRLSLTTATPVTTVDVTAASTIYWTPDRHNMVTLKDGTTWRNTVSAELSLTLDSDSGHTGYHQSGKNFDVWGDYNAGTPRIGTGAAWTNDTTRADARTRDAVTGLYVNNATVTFRYGAASGDTASKAAGTLTYLGTFRASANGQTEDSVSKRFLWNGFNRRGRVLRYTDSTDTWTLTASSIRQARNQSGAKVEWVCGDSDDEVDVQLHASMSNDTTLTQTLAGIGIDSIAAYTTWAIWVPVVALGDGMTLSARWMGWPGLGYHYASWLENTSGGTATYGGDNGQTQFGSNLTAKVMA